MGIVILLSGCASGQPKKDIGKYKAPENSFHVPYYLGGGGSEISLAVPRPEGIDLTENELWLPAYIQGTLITDISKFSAINVSSREDSDAAAPEPDGEIAGVSAANHILSGRIRKTSTTEYLFQLTLTETETGVQKAAYSKEIAAIFLRDSSALHEAAQDVLSQIGVELNDEGKAAILQINPEEREGAVALAKGLMAEQGGSQIAAMGYLYSAVSYDSSLKEAVDRLETLNRDFSGSLGDAIQNDVSARNFWKQMTDEFESFYTAHPPFELVFTPLPSKKGETDYNANTVNLKFDIVFRESPELDGMRQVLQIIMEGLDRTQKKDEWGFGRWPYSAKLFGGRREFVFKAELVNDNNTSLKTMTFTAMGRLLSYRTGIYPDASGTEELVFTDINVDSLTSSPRVRMISVDGIEAEQSGIEGYIQFSPAEEPPSAGAKNLLVYLTRNPF